MAFFFFAITLLLAFNARVAHPDVAPDYAGRGESSGPGPLTRPALEATGTLVEPLGLLSGHRGEARGRATQRGLTRAT